MALRDEKCEFYVYRFQPKNRYGDANDELIARYPLSPSGYRSAIHDASRARKRSGKLQGEVIVELVCPKGAITLLSCKTGSTGGCRPAHQGPKSAGGYRRSIASTKRRSR